MRNDISSGAMGALRRSVHNAKRVDGGRTYVSLMLTPHVILVVMVFKVITLVEQILTCNSW